MYLRDFQICLRDHDPQIYLRLGECWDPIELEIRRSIPKRFNFGGIGKLVLELGPGKLQTPEYLVLLNVGLYHYENFNVSAHLSMSQADRRNETLDIIQICLSELATRFHASDEWATSAISKFRTVGF